jgi:GT2 family glycosyltransferase
MARKKNTLLDWLRANNRERINRRRVALGKNPMPLEWSSLPAAKHLVLPVPINALIAPQSIPLATSAQPEISIIIPAYGKAEVTLRCLASLHQHPPSVPYEVLVVEDCSGEPGADAVSNVSGIRFINNASNLGFLRSCNAAAAQSRGRYLLLLNNDTQVMPGAVDALHRVFTSHPKAGLVGAKLIYPDGTLQEAGGIVWSDGSARNHGRGRHPDEPCFNFLRETDYISGAAIMIDAALWRQRGGFDERFCPAYYEDTDFAMQVRAAGRQVIYQHESVVVHLEGVSNGTDDKPGIKKYQYTNAVKFAEKWQHILERDHFQPDAGHEFRARERAKQRKVLLVVDPTMIQPDADAGSKSTDEFINTMMGLGWLVKFWPQDGARPDRYAQAMQARGIEVLTGGGRPRFSEWIASHGRHIDAFLLSRPSAAAAVLPDIRRHSCGRVVYYGHDIHHARMSLQATTLGDASAAAAGKLMQDTEHSLWQRADVVLYLSQDEADVVLRLDPTIDARAVQLYCFDRPQPRLWQPAKPLLQFVAGFAHPPNVDAAQWLVRQVMPLVWQRWPAMPLRLVGSKPSADVLALASPLVTVTGWVSDEQLSAMYGEATVSLAPLRFGAGVKLKVVEALAHAVPLVTTSVGAQGLDGLAQACAVHDAPEAFAQAILDLLDSEPLWQARSASAASYVGQRFSRHRMRQALAQVFDCNAG